MKCLGVVITDGVGFRNFILTDFLTEAQKKFDRVVIFSCLPKSTYEELSVSCEVVELEVFTEQFKHWFFRKAKETAHLQLHRKSNFGIQDNFALNNATALTTRGITTRLIINFTRFFHSEKWILRFNTWQQHSFARHSITQSYCKLLQEYGITQLFFTHQRPPYVAPLIYAAERLAIKTSTFIFSWDNLASKGRMAGNFDFFLVWSSLMQKELLHFYSSVKSHQVAVVGTPQFEPYVLDRYGYSKEVLCQKFNLNPEYPIILFTCNDSTSKNDPLYLEQLARFIQNNELVKSVNLIVRTSPAEEPLRFKKLSEMFPFIRWNYPSWENKRSNHQEQWSQRVPSATDLSDLKALLMHSDLNINVLSTITLDACLFDKPVINPVFGNPQNGMFDDQKFLNYEHLKHMVNSHCSHIVKDKETFLKTLNEMLSGSDGQNEQRKAFVDLEIGLPLHGTSARIAETLYQWS